MPRAVTCANCGCEGAEFDWYQRIPADAVEDDTPATDRHFCGIVCLGTYVAATLPGYDPVPRSTHVTDD